MTFDPYLKWLGIRDSTRPVSHYRLLGIEDYESDTDVISLAADRQMGHVRRFQNSEHSADSQRILNEIAAAKVCLLDDAKRGDYDRQLRASRRKPVAGTAERYSGFARLLPVATVLLLGGAILTVGYLWGVGRWSTPAIVNQSTTDADGDGEELAASNKASLDTSRGNATGDGGTPTVVRRIPVSTVSPWVQPDRARDDKTSFESPFLESLANRSFEQANALINEPQFRSQFSDEQFEQLERLASDTQGFWTAVRSGIQFLEPGKVLAYRHQPVEVMSKSSDELKLVAGDGSECSFSLDQSTIELELAISLARPFLSTDSRQAELVIATLRDLDQRNMANFPQPRVAVAESSPPNHESIDNSASVVEPPKPVPPITSIVQRPTSPRIVEPQDDRFLVPHKSDRDKAKPHVRRTIAELTANHSHELVAKGLLESASRTKELPLKYELLVMARARGFANGDLASALQSSTEMHRQFQVDTVELIKQTVMDGSKRVRGKQLAQLLAFGKSHVRESIARDDFDGARELSRTLVGLSKRLKDADLSQAIRDARDSVDVIEQHYFEAHEHLKVLAEDSENAESNRIVGLFLVADKDDLEAARPYLARSGVERLAQLSSLPRSVRERLQTADAWWELAAEFSDHRRRNLQGRAFSIYRNVFPQVSGIQKSRIRDKISKSLAMDPLLAELLGQVWKVEWTDEPAWTSLTFNKDGTGKLIADRRENDVTWQLSDKAIFLTLKEGVIYSLRMNGNGLLDCERRRIATRRVEATGLGKPIALSSNLGWASK